MEEEVIYIKVTPDVLGYQDRGIMKWQGLILSAQTEAIKEINEWKKVMNHSLKKRCRKKKYLKSYS